MRPSAYYASLEDAVKAQQTGATVNNPEMPKTRRDFLSVFLVAIILLSLAAFNYAFTAGNKPLSTVGIVT